MLLVAALVASQHSGSGSVGCEAAKKRLVDAEARRSVPGGARVPGCRLHRLASRGSRGCGLLRVFWVRGELRSSFRSL
jgi:hypothetical protein